MTKICPYQVFAHRLVLPSGGPKDDPENDRRRPQGLEVHVLFDAILDPKKIIFVLLYLTDNYQFLGPPSPVLFKTITYIVVHTIHIITAKAVSII